jgi:hypothetical protein
MWIQGSIEWQAAPDGVIATITTMRGKQVVTTIDLHFTRATAEGMIRDICAKAKLPEPWSS